MTIGREDRIGPTAGWPATLLFMRFDGRRRGLWLRLGNRAWYIVLVPRGDTVSERIADVLKRWEQVRQDIGDPQHPICALYDQVARAARIAGTQQQGGTHGPRPKP